MSHTITVKTTLTTLNCAECGMLYAITTEFEKQRLLDRTSFYCPAGHGQWFPGKTETELRKESDLAAANAKEEVRILRAELSKQRKAKATADRRAKAALCPVPGCKRSFVQMDRHLHTKHPDYAHACGVPQ